MARGFVVGVLAGPLLLLLFGLLFAHFWLVVAVVGAIVLLSAAAVTIAVLVQSSSQRNRDKVDATVVQFDPVPNLPAGAQRLASFAPKAWMPLVPLTELPCHRAAFRQKAGAHRTTTKPPATR